MIILSGIHFRNILIIADGGGSISAIELSNDSSYSNELRFRYLDVEIRLFLFVNLFYFIFLICF